MRFGRAAGVPDVSQHLPRFYLIAHFYPDRAWPHVRIERVAIAADIHNRMIAARVDEIDLHHILARMRDVFRYAVHRVHHGAIGHAINWRVIAEIAAVLVFWSRPRGRDSVDHAVAHPVNRITLGEPGMSARQKDRPAMGRVRTVVDRVSRKPIVAAKRSGDHRWRLLRHVQWLRP